MTRWGTRARRRSGRNLPHDETGVGIDELVFEATNEIAAVVNDSEAPVGLNGPALQQLRVVHAAEEGAVTAMSD